ncbi:MAG: NAD-dependent epimerase/dehydratase family protein [Candidatus Omnitrophica bacterium]|nr:NAD-dependent epimerase/dehydratase family protein [Candidatus Omnitrophota bacterium]
MKNILITGGCGFIGSNLAVYFADQGYTVTALDNLSRRGSELLRDRVEARGIKFVLGDVRRSQDLNSLKENFDLMVECSAEPSVLVGTNGQDARYLLDVNLQGAINCFEWARERRVPVIFLSTSRVYPYDQLNACQYKETSTRFEFVDGCAGVSAKGVSLDMPLKGVRSLYGTSKLCAELILQEYAALYDLPSIINRSGVIAGPWQLGKVDQGVFTFWLASHYFKKPLEYIGFGGEGKQVRDLLHVEDLNELIFKQAQCLIVDNPKYRGDIFNVGGSCHSNLSLQEATALCSELTGNKLAIGKNLKTRPADVIWYITDNGNTGEIFDWIPKRSAKKILEDTFGWLKEDEADFKKIFR